MISYQRPLRMMLERLRQRGIKDQQVLNAMNRVLRHRFVQPGMEFQAYDEKALPIGFEQTISHPYTVALMTQALQPNDNKRILEIGTGSGYQAAVILECGAQLFTIERIPQLADRARFVLEELGYRFLLKCGDGTLGWPAYAPFDGIIVTAGAPVFPKKLLKQLKNGGRCLIPIGSEKGQVLTLFIRDGDTFIRQELENLSFVPLIGREGWNKS